MLRILKTNWETVMSKIWSKIDLLLTSLYSVIKISLDLLLFFHQANSAAEAPSGASEEHRSHKPKEKLRS